jgi:hypothetical protein
MPATDGRVYQQHDQGVGDVDETEQVPLVVDEVHPIQSGIGWSKFSSCNRNLRRKATDQKLLARVTHNLSN